MKQELLNLIKDDLIAVEMARRKVVFHYYEKWDTITLWGLFRYKNIKKHIDDGKLINNLNYKPKNLTYWVIPSKEYWENAIEPITKKFTKDELQDTFWVEK